MATNGRQTPLIRMVIRATVLALFAAGVATIPAAAAQPEHGTPSWSRADYLALGDSVAFGYRPPEVTPPADYLNADNFVGYPEDFAKAAGLELANASCSGETTTSLIVPGGQSNGCENSVGSPVGYRTAFPLHVSYAGTQLNYAIQYLRSHPRTRLVTIDIGANDMFVCQETTADHCTGADYAAGLKQVARNLATIYAALRYQAHYRYALVLVSYYSLDYRDAAQSAQSRQLNAALAAPTERFGGIVADSYGAFQRASAQAGGDTCAAGLLIALPAGGCNIHPSALGHRVLAAAVANALWRFRR